MVALFYGCSRLYTYSILTNMIRSELGNFWYKNVLIGTSSECVKFSRPPSRLSLTLVGFRNAAVALLSYLIYIAHTAVCNNMVLCFLAVHVARSLLCLNLKMRHRLSFLVHILQCLNPKVHSKRNVRVRRKSQFRARPIGSCRTCQAVHNRGEHIKQHPKRRR